jgi:hypothetical protein
LGKWHVGLCSCCGKPVIGQGQMTCAMEKHGLSVLCTWVYSSSQIILMGSEFTHV